MPRKSVRVRIAVVFVSLALVAFAAVKFVSYAQKKAAPSVGPSVTATETLTDPSGLGTNNGDGKAQPGETLLATVTITNNGSDATAVSLSDSPANPLSPNGANGTAALGVIAANDTYSTIGNTGMLIPTGAGSVLSNDVNPSGAGTLAVSKFGFTSGTAGANNAGTTQTSPNNSSVKLDADGTLTYTPGVSFTGSEDIFYTLTNGVAGTPTSVGKITVTVSGKIWYINNGATACTTLTVASQCGTTAKPFTSLASFQAVNDGAAGPPAHPAAGDTIFIYESGVGYTGPVTLLANQKLIGQDATSSLLSITGYSAPSGTSQVPVMNPGAGNVATINSSATNGVNLGSGNTIRGLTISGTTGAKIAGTGFGTVVLGNSASPDLSLSGAGQAMNLTTGTLSVGGGLVTTASTSSSGQGLVLAGVADSDGAGGGAFSFGSTSISGSSTQGILIGTTTADLNFGNTSVTGGTDGVSFQNNSAGTRTFGTLGVSGGTGNAFLHAVGGGNVTVTGAATLSSPQAGFGASGMASGSAINFQSATSVTATAAGANGLSVSGTNTGSTITFNALTVQNASAGIALSLSGGGTFNVTNGTGTVNNTVNSSAVVNANGLTLNANFASANSNGGGMTFTNVSGTSNFGSGAISGASGNLFAVSGSNPNITYSGTLSHTASTRIVDIQGTTGGTITLSGTITSGSANGGVHIGDTSTANGNVTFTTLNLGTSGSRMTNQAVTITGGSGTYGLGTANIFTSGAQGIVATNVTGTINSTAGTIDASSQRAVNIAGVSTASKTALGMTLTSVSSSSSSTNGITLTNTSGTFTIAGDGGGANNGSGGTITASTSHGVFLTSVGTVSLGYMNITNPGAMGVYAAPSGWVPGSTSTTNGISGFTMNRCTFSDNAGSNTADDGLSLANVTGTVSITNNTFTAARHQGVTIENFSNNIASFTMTGNTISNVPGGDGMLLEMRGTSVMTTAAIGGATAALGNTFSGNSATGFQISNGDTGNIASMNIQNNTSTGNNAGMDLDLSQSSSYTLTIQNNLYTKNHSTALNLVQSTSSTAGTLTASIKNNTIGCSGTGVTGCSGGVLDSGSAIGNGIAVRNGGVTINLTIDSNTIREVPNGRGIDIEDQAYSVNDAEKVKITNNNIVRPTGTAQNIGCGANVPCPSASVFILSDSNGLGGFKNACSVITGNSAYDPTSWPAGGEAAFYLARRTSASNQLRLEGNTAQSPQTNVLGNNTVTNSTAAPFVDEGTSGPTVVVVAGTCGTFPAAPSGVELGMAGTAEFEPFVAEPLGTNSAEIALAGPIENVLGDMARAEVISIPRQAATEDKPSLIAELYDKLTSNIEPTVEAQSGPASGSITTTPTFTLPAGSSVTITYQLTVANGPYPAGLNNLTDAASVSGSNFATVTATPTASIPLDASPSITVANTDASGETQPGTTIVYAVSATNANIINGQDATGVVLTQTVPTNTTFNAAASAAGWTGCVNGSPGGTVCTNTIGALSANGTAVTKNFAVDVPGPLAATVTSIGDTGSVADDGTNGANQGAPTSQLDTDTVRGTWTGGTSTDFATATNWVNNLLPNPGQNISIPSGGGANAPTLGSGTVVTNSVFFSGKDLTISAGANLTANTSVSLVTNKVLGAGTLELGNGATITRTTGQVNCALKKNFLNGAIPPPAGATDGAEATTTEATTAAANAPDAPQAVFTFPVGTAAGYFPVDVTPTAGSTGNLTIQTFDGTAGVVPPLDNTKTLQRYWTLTGGAGITASLKFFYNATTVNGNEANYKPNRVTGGTATSFADNCPAGTCVDETNNFIFMPSVSTFAGNWTASELAPTAAMVGVSGRVLSADGRAVRGVRVTLDDGTGHPMTVISNAFGYYHFDEVQSGGTYILGATARGYTFTPRVVSVTDELTSVDLTALP